MSTFCQSRLCEGNEPEWGWECIKKLVVGEGIKMYDVLDKDCIEIYEGYKDRHLAEIKKKSGAQFEEMIFFDDRGDNCHTVARLGVTVVHTPHGVTRQLWEMGMDRFPAP